MLPDFPGIKVRLREALDRLMDDMVYNDPILSQIRREHHFEGHRMSMEPEGGETQDSGYREVTGTQEIKAEDVIQRGILVYVEHLDTLAEEMRAQIKKFLFEDIDRITHQTGNVVDVEGKEFSLDHYLELLGKIHMDFDDEGNPIFPDHIAHPDTARMLETKLREWLQDSESSKKIHMALEAKRKEWDARESHRQLVD